MQICCDDLPWTYWYIGFIHGFLTIAEKAGGIRFLSRIVGPFFSRLFPELPKGHPAIGHMIMNFSATY